MLLCEIFAPTFYLGSHTSLSGKVTRHDLRIDVHPRHNGVEVVLERARPAYCLSRSQCVLLADNRDGVAKLGMPVQHLYQAEPVGDVQRSDVGWWRMIADALARVKQERSEGIAEWAAQYWDGSECPHTSPTWEYRAAAVLIG